MKYLSSIITFLFCALVFTSCFEDQDQVLLPFEYNKHQMGDSIEWAAKNYDDRHWTTEINDDQNDLSQVFWVRMKVFFPKRERPYTNMGTSIFGTGSYEIYWDGKWVGQNGRLESKNTREEYGSYKTLFHLPDSMLQNGEHVIALRMTMSAEDIGHHAYYMTADFKKLASEPLQISKFMFLIGGMFIVAAFYFLFLFGNNPKAYSTLLFCIICLIFFAILLLEYLKLFYAYPYPFQRTRLEWIGYLHVCLSVLVPWFFALEFKFPWKKYLIGFIVLVIVVLEVKYSQNFDSLAIYESRVMWTSSLLIVLYALWERKKEALIVLLGFLGSFIVFYLVQFIDLPYVSEYDLALFCGFTCIVLSMLYLITYRRAKERKAYEASLVFSERLKNELLKKNIKPHFIMNTLTSLIDWVEESPKDGVELIHALAGEFEVLNDIADHKLIPIEQEIKLCENHLKVMSFRKEIDYRWSTNGIDKNEIIPPAIIHTAIENGVTHSLPEDGAIDFFLSFSKDKSWRTYTLIVKSLTKTTTSTHSEHNDHEGTGTKYIKARLSESYSNQWEYHSNKHPEGWIHTFKLPA